jgi:uncharacterized protein (DUF58 family)
VNGKAATLLALVYGLLLAALALRCAEAAWMAAPLLTTLVLGVLRAPDRGAIRLRVNRKVERGADGRVEVSARIRNEGTSVLHLRIEDRPPPGVAVEEGSPVRRALLAAGAETELRYAFGATRGRFAWDTLLAVATDPLGLLEERFELAAPGELHLLPDPPRLRPLPIRPGRTVPTPGSIPARVGGSGTEFFGVREYHVGDALRWIDWRLTARHPGQLFTREFEQEQIADVGLVLDARAPGDRGGSDDVLFEQALTATASLAATLLRQGNRVSLLVLGEGDAKVFPGTGRVQLQRILSCLAGAQPSPGLHRDTGHSLVRMFPARSIVVVLSPLPGDDLALLPRLRAHERQVLLVSPDPFELSPVAPRPEEQLALRAARIERQLHLRAVGQLHVTVVDWKVSRPLYPLLRAALQPARGGRRP